jgi:hypothetical protein
MKSWLGDLQPKYKIFSVPFWCFLSWMNPRNGANPVPGPTIKIGVFESRGSLKLDFWTNTGSVEVCSDHVSVQVANSTIRIDSLWQIICTNTQVPSICGCEKIYHHCRDMNAPRMLLEGNCGLQNAPEQYLWRGRNGIVSGRETWNNLHEVVEWNR